MFLRFDANAGDVESSASMHLPWRLSVEIANP